MFSPEHGRNKMYDGLLWYKYYVTKITHVFSTSEELCWFWP